jgi:hypothetical protein
MENTDGMQIPWAYFEIRSSLMNGHSLPSLEVDGTIASHAEKLNYHQSLL